MSLVNNTLFPFTLMMDPTPSGLKVLGDIDDNEDIMVGDMADTSFTENHVTSGSEVSYYTKFPKFIQAIFTIVVCGILLVSTLGLIKYTKYWCSKRVCRRPPPSIDDIELSVTSPDKTDSDDIEHPTCSSIGSLRKQNEKFLSVHNNSTKKSPRIVRRPSGPFSEQFMQFTEESYHAKLHEYKREKPDKRPGSADSTKASSSKASMKNHDKQKK